MPQAMANAALARSIIEYIFRREVETMRKTVLNLDRAGAFGWCKAATALSMPFGPPATLAFRQSGNESRIKRSASRKVLPALSQEGKKQQVSVDGRVINKSSCAKSPASLLATASRFPTPAQQT